MGTKVWIASSLMLTAVLVSSPGAKTEAQSETADPAPSQIQRTVRAFYFNLAHGDWDAVTADILAAKVVAHRPAPEGLIALGSAGGTGVSTEMVGCSSGGRSPDVNRSSIVLDGDWAEVTVPRCGAGVGAADEFRLIHFEARWRFVYIDLFDEPVNVSAER